MIPLLFPYFPYYEADFADLACGRNLQRCCDGCFLTKKHQMFFRLFSFISRKVKDILCVFTLGCEGTACVFVWFNGQGIFIIQPLLWGIWVSISFTSLTILNFRIAPKARVPKPVFSTQPLSLSLWLRPKWLSWRTFLSIFQSHFSMSKISRIFMKKKS